MVPMPNSNRVGDRWARARSIGVALTVAAALASSALARDPRPTPSTETRKAQAVSRWAFERLHAAHFALEQEKFDEAEQALQPMLSRNNLSDQEKALMWQALAYVHSAREDHEKAVDAFENSLASGGLPNEAALVITYNLAQLCVILERYERAVELFDLWFAEAARPNAGAHYMYAIAAMQIEQFPKAIAHAEQAVEKSKAPRESYLQLLLALYFEVKDYTKAAGVLSQLAANFPKKIYWKQLSAVHAELGDNAKALATLEIAYLQGLLDEEGELLNLAQLYLYNDLPAQAATVMDEALAAGTVDGDAVAWQILADSWLQARERDKARAPLERAAELSTDGQLYVRLAQIHLGDEEWAAARRALARAMEKGGLRNSGQIQLLLGIAHTGEQHWSEAECAFQAAMRHPDAERMATAWLANLEREQVLAGH